MPSIRKKPALLGILFFFVILSGAYSQAPTRLAEDISQYNQAVSNKDYEKAAQYAFKVGMLYGETKDLNNAISYVSQSITYAKKTGDQSILYAAFHQLGAYFMDLKKYKKALENYQSALSSAQALKNNKLIKGEFINVSISYGFTQRYKKSIEYAEEALSLAISQGDTLLQQKCYQLLTEFHAKQGNKKRSIEYHAQYTLLVSTQQNEALKKREIKELEQHIENVALENLATQSELVDRTKKLQQTNASLQIIENSLLVATDSLKEIETISNARLLEIDLLRSEKELASIKISEQEARIENEALVRNFIGVGSVLSVALIVVLIISYNKQRNSNKKINQQNKNIKSSINYAKRIQEAMLPKIDHYPLIFQNSFILFEPRDTVSGDFYWLSDVKKSAADSDLAFAAVDCTGHGVPGAFMSMIGINALNGLVNQGITETHKILDSLDQEIRNTLRQDSSGNNDGMDIALCIYRQRDKILEFSGAKNPLIYIQNNELFQVKGDIHSIGGSKHKHQFLFKKHEIAIDKPTTIYLFSDGYKDQFGGKDNGKFLSKKLNKLLLSIHHLPMQEQTEILQITFNEWKGKRHQTDDILVIGLKLEPTLE